jgi:signal transduction histidine kinase
VALQKGVSLHLDLPAKAEVWGSPSKLAQVVTNLVDNALKYTGSQVGRGPGRVWVTMCTDGPHVRLTVRDDGIGIDPSEQEAIFERFHRVSSGPAAQLGGTGLGLAIARELVVSHRGSIRVSSTMDQGSSFVVEIPREAPAS